MIEKFNNIFLLIIYLIHFLGVGVYAFQTITDTKKFMKKFGIDNSGAIMIRLAGAFMLAVFLMFLCLPKKMFFFELGPGEEGRGEATRWREK